MKKTNSTILLGLILLMLGGISESTTAQVPTGTVTDYDGNTYKTIKIGNYWWMAENLRTKHFNNGDAIPQISGMPSTATASSNLPLWSYPNNDANNQTTYGLLYSWGAATDSRCGCPTGWSLPDTTIWYAMAKTLKNGGVKLWNGAIDAGWSKVGTRLKSDSGWAYYAATTVPTDSLGFNALSAGGLTTSAYESFGNEARFWTTNYVQTAAQNGRRYMSLKYTSDDLTREQSNTINHTSIRCVKLASGTTAIPSVSNTELQATISRTGNQLTITAEKAASYSLYQLNGAKLLTGSIQGGTVTFTTNQYAAGVYILAVENQLSSKRLKIIIQ